LGEQFIIDPSGTAYASNDPNSFISRQLSGFLHNTITVDGVDEFMGCRSVDCGPIPWETKAPLQNIWEHGDKYTLFAGSYSFAPVKPVKWERRVVFVDKSYWLLQDVLAGELPEAEIEQNFQFDAEIEIEFQDNITIAKAPSGAMLALVPLEGGLTPKVTVGDREPHTTYWPYGTPTDVLFVDDGRPQQHGRGWTGRNTSKLIPAPAVTYVGTLDPFPPAPITLLIVPLEPGQTLEDVPEVTREGERWTLPIEGGSLRFDANPRRCRLLEDNG
jgi:hypothetical protein